MLENEGNKFQIVIPGCALLAQARNPYSLQGLWIPGSFASLPPRNDDLKTQSPSTILATMSRWISDEPPKMV
jgi:hypothetical protein